MNVLVTTSDKGLPSLPGFAYLFNKHFSPQQPVVVAGFTPPTFRLPRNFKFVSLGEMADYPWQKWSDALIKFLEWRYDWDNFLLLFEDYWLTRQVNLHAIDMLWDYMATYQFVAKMDLAADRLYSSGMTDFDRVGYIDLIKSNPESEYHCSLWPGIWNRKRMLELLIPDESPHDIEINGTVRLREQGDKVLVLGTRQYPMRISCIMKKGVAGYNLDGLHTQDIRELKELGYLNMGENPV